MNKSNYNISQLREIAKSRKIKYYNNYNKNELEKMLGFEITKPNEKYEKYCRGKINKPISIIIKNKETGEILTFISLHSAAKNFNINAECIKYRIKTKKDLKSNGKTFSITQSVASKLL